MGTNISHGILDIDAKTDGVVTGLQAIQTQAQKVSQVTAGMGSSLSGMLGTVAGIGVGIGTIGFGLMKIKGLYDDWNAAQQASADLFSQFGDDAPMVFADFAVQIQNAADGMMTIQTAAKAFNLLVRSEVGASIEQVQSLAKASYEISERTGQDINQVMDDMSRAVLTGQMRTIKAYGVMIDESNVTADANIRAMQKFGEAANEEDIRKEKSRNILERINAQYKDQLVTAGDIMDIEAKYQNERSRNAAISAKANEAMAKQLQELKHGWQDIKDKATDYFTGLEHNSKRVMDTISEGSKRQLQDLEVDWGYRMESLYGFAYQEGEGLSHYYEVMTRKIGDNTRNLAVSLDFLYSKDADTLAGLEQAQGRRLGQIEKEITFSRMLASLQRATGQTERAEQIEGVVRALEQEEKQLEKNQEMIANAKIYQVAQAGLKGVQTVLMETSTHLEKNAHTLKQYQSMTEQDLAAAAKGHEAEAGKLRSKIDHYKTIEKLNKSLTPEQRIHLQLLEKQEKAINGQLEMVEKVWSLITGKKMGMKPEETGTRGQAAAWEKEYAQIQQLLKRGDVDLNQALEAKYGTLDPEKIKQKLKDANSEILKFERTVNEEHARILKERSDATTTQLAAEEEGRKLEAERRRNETFSQFDSEKKMIEEMTTYRVDWAAKIAGLDASRKRTHEQVLKDDITELEKKILLAKQAQGQYQDLLDEMNKAEDKDFEKFQEVKGAQARALQEEYNLRSLYKDKTIELKKQENKELREEMKKAAEEMKGWGNQLLKTGAGALWDAMTIEKAALKESYMSRSEMIARALKDELQNIAKQAGVQALYQGAMSLASYAIGDAKGGTAHAAAALAYAAVAGVSLGASKMITAPSAAEIERRKAAGGEASGGIENSRASVGGARAQQTIIHNHYWPAGLIIADRDDMIREINRSSLEAERRGQYA